VQGGRANYVLKIIVGAVDRTRGAFGRIDSAVSRLGRVTFQATRGLAVLGAAGAGALLFLTNSTTKAADATAKLSRRLGLNSQALQEWRYAAELNGVETTVFDNALRKLGQRMAEARAGYGEGRLALHALGISLVDAEGKAKGLEEVFPELLTALDNVADPTAKLALAVKLFESEGTSLIQMAGGGANALAQLGREARRTGNVLSDEQLQASEKYQDSLTRFRALVSGMKNRLVTSLLPSIQLVSDRITTWLTANQDQFNVWGLFLSDVIPRAFEFMGKVGGAVFTSLSTLAQFLAPWLERSAAGLNAMGEYALLVIERMQPAFRVIGEVARFVSDQIAGVLSQAREVWDILGRINIFGGSSNTSVPKSAGPPQPIPYREDFELPQVGPSGELKILFSNAPAGMRVERNSTAKATTNLRVGYAMPEVALG